MKYIAEQYSKYEYPLIPSEADLGAYQYFIDEYVDRAGDSTFNVLICGVTPHLVSLKYPESTFILGVDFTEEMIQYVWPGDIPNKRQALKANWLDMEVEPSSIDIMLGDGSLNFLDDVAYDTFLRKTTGFLKPQGIMINRIYLSNNHDSPEECYQGIFEKRYAHLTEFRLKFMQSLQRDESDGVLMAEVYDQWMNMKPDVEAIAKQTGYDVSIIEGMNLYKNKQAKLYFHPVHFHETLMRKYFQDVEAIRPESNMGDVVPVIAAKKPTLRV